MATYRFKNGKLPSALDKKSAVTENTPVQEEVQGAFFPAEESTKSWSVEPRSNDNFFNPFADEEEEKKTSRIKLKSFLGAKKKDNEEEVLERVGQIYAGSSSSADGTDNAENLGAQTDLSEVFGEKKKKKAFFKDADGENDTYDLESSPIEEHESKYSDMEIYDPDDDNDDIPYEDEYLIKKKKLKEEAREYIDPLEKEEFYVNYRARSRKALFSVFSSLLITLILFYLESPTLLHPSWLTPGKFGILYLLCDLQLLLLSGLCVFDRLYNGAISLFKWQPTKHSVTFIMYTSAVFQVLIHLIVDRYNENIVLFSSIASFAALISAIAHFFDTRREGISFRMAATSTPKYIAKSLDSNSEEYAKFSEYLPEDPYMYSISKTNFVSNFVANSKKASTFDEIYKITLPIVLFTSLIFAIVANLMAGVPTFSRGLDNFILALMISTPVSSILSVALPFFKGTLKLSRRGCTVIGEDSLDKYSSTSVLSFKDTDIFHEKGIKVTSVKTYGQTRIDTAILTAARVFNIVGGPLKNVFNRSILDAGKTDSGNDEVMQILPSSIMSIIDGKKVLVGTKEAMMSTGLDCGEDRFDDMFEASCGRIMYMSINEELAAKFYVKYALGKNFKSILDSFYNIGICMAVKSCDPNLDTEFITKLLKDENYPIVILKLENTDTTALEKVTDKNTSGIVSNTSIPNMMRTLLWCDKCRRIISLNHLAKYIAILLSVIFLVVCLFNANAHEKITPVVVLLYQLIWMAPACITSIFQ